MGSPRRRIAWARCAEIEPAQTAERIAAPRPVVDAMPHRLAELAVTGDVDAEVPLVPYDIADRRAQLLLEQVLVARVASFTGRGSPRSAHRDAAGCRHGWW